MLGRILLADDSEHAQRMGERILREDGFVLLTATDGEEALDQLSHGAPDVMLSDAYLPGQYDDIYRPGPLHGGSDVCQSAGKR